MGGLQLAAKGEAARGEADRREATRGARVGRETARAADQDLLDRREGGQKWPRTVWIWSPELGRWKPEYGRPRQPVALTVSTDDVRRSEAFDYWRDIAYYHFDARRPPPESLSRFRAQAHGLITPGGDLFLYTSSGVTGQRTARQIRADGGASFDFGMVLSGVRVHRDEQEGVIISGPGDFFCYDATRVSRVRWDDHRGVHLSLSRAMVQRAMGQPVPPASAIIRRLQESSLTPFLRAQLGVLVQQYESLSVRERSVMLQATVDLLLTVLRESFSTETDGPDTSLGAYFTAAKRVIHQRFADPGLDAETVANLLNCSRATLYRAFKEHGVTVARYIREVRLQEARRRIAVSAPGASIAAIAEECGFYDPTYFRRLFRERFDMNPSDVRDLE